MYLKKHHVQQSPVTVTDSTTNANQYIVSIPKSWLTEMRAEFKCSPSEGDLVQETLAIVHGYDTVRGWEASVGEMAHGKASGSGIRYYFNNRSKLAEQFNL